MKRSFAKQLSQVTAILLTTIFIMVSVFGLFCLGMSLEQGMSMSDCPLMGATSAMCPMKILDHISIWQKLFTAITPSLTLLAIALSAVFSCWQLLFDHDPPDIALRLKKYQKTHLGFRLYNFLLHIFARGIVQPKLFA
ncbi:MAG: hypothetical protein EXS55_01560 [Candidatus Magasanikbacteria bacterium]|nr:hypothetical protein [Candidatus Magasanikbacteria bacterium]